MRPRASPASASSSGVDDLDASDVAVGTKVVPRASRVQIRAAVRFSLRRALEAWWPPYDDCSVVRENVRYIRRLINPNYTDTSAVVVEHSRGERSQRVYLSLQTLANRIDEPTTRWFPCRDHLASLHTDQNPTT